MSENDFLTAFRARLDTAVERSKRQPATKPVHRRAVLNGRKNNVGQRAAIEALLLADPRPSYGEIAAKTGVSRQRVGQIANDLKDEAGS